MLSARAGSPGGSLPKRVPPPVPRKRRAPSSQSSGALFSKYRMNDIPRGTPYSKLMNSLLVDPYGEDCAPPRSHVQCGLVMTDSRLDDELSVATIEFTDTPKWLKNLARDPNGFPKKTTYGTLWNMTTVNTTAQDQDGKTEFIRAVIRGVDRVNLFYPEMLAEFTDVDVNVQDKMGRTALHWASECGLIDMVILCLSVPDCDTGLRDNDGLTAFDLSRGDSAVNVQTLFYSSIFDMETRDPQSALLRALTITSEPDDDKPIFPGQSLFDPIRDRNSPLITALIDRQVDLTTRDGDGNTALHIAAGEAGNAEIVSQLLEAGADINAKGAGGATPLHQASAIAEVVQVLLQWNADRTIQDTDGMTALQRAVQDGHGEVAELLQHHQAPAPKSRVRDSAGLQLAQEIQSPVGIPEASPEEEARMKEERRQERFLRFQPLSPEERDSSMCRAAKEGDLDSVQVLLEMGVNTDATDYLSRKALVPAPGGGLHLVAFGETALMHASREGHHEVVKTLLAAGANVDTKTINGETALLQASNQGHHEVVKTVIGAAANLEIATQFGETALLRASDQGHHEVVKTLLAAGANLENVTEFGETALLRASNHGHHEVVKTLLAAGADIDPRCRMGETPLTQASGRGHLEIVGTLLAAGADFNIRTHAGETALIRASSRGRHEIVKTLLAAGADINAQSKTGETALICASGLGHGVIVQTLLAAGAEIITQTNRGETALMCASGKGHRQVSRTLLAAEVSFGGTTSLMLASGQGEHALVQTLLKAGADVNAQSKTGETALTRAGAEGHHEIVKILLDVGADVEVPFSGTTALMRASSQGQYPLVKMLLDAGADINAQSETGETALTRASSKGYHEIVKILLDAGADINTQTIAGQTALIWASRHGQHTVVKTLLDAGADINIQTIAGQTALIWASRQGQHIVVKTLLDAGADVQVSFDGKTALRWALDNGHNDVADTLRLAGALSRAGRVRYVTLRTLGIKAKGK